MHPRGSVILEEQPPAGRDPARELKRRAVEDQEVDAGPQEYNDVVVVTRASVTGGRAALAARKRLDRFLAGRPCVIVVDEAHHAIAPSYEAMLDHVFTVTDPLLVGLTATPWPAGDGARRPRKRFPAKVADVRARELIESGVLARPQFRVVDTSATNTDSQRIEDSLTLLFHAAGGVDGADHGDRLR